MKIHQMFDVTLRVDPETMAAVMIDYASSVQSVSVAPIENGDPNKGMRVQRGSIVKHSATLALAPKQPTYTSGSMRLAQQALIKAFAGRTTMPRQGVTKAVKEEFERSGKYMSQTAVPTISGLIKTGSLIVK